MACCDIFPPSVHFNQNNVPNFDLDLPLIDAINGIYEGHAFNGPTEYVITYTWCSGGPLYYGQVAFPPQSTYGLTAVPDVSPYCLQNGQYLFANVDGDIWTITSNAGPGPVVNGGGFSPQITHEGGTIVITGSGFTGATSVTINGTSATYTVDNDGRITVVVPPGATSGPIVITTPGGETETGPVFITPELGGPLICHYA